MRIDHPIKRGLLSRSVISLITVCLLAPPARHNDNTITVCLLAPPRHNDRHANNKGQHMCVVYVSSVCPSVSVCIEISLAQVDIP